MPKHGDANWTRRAALHGGIFAALGATMAPGLLRAAEANNAAAALGKLPLITKAIPSTGERIPAVGIGTNNFTTAQYAQLKELLSEMYATGGTFVDTASDYSDAEVVIGRAVSELNLRQKLFLSTKCISKGGWPRWASATYVPELIYGEEAFTRSLQRLQTDHVDLMLAHQLRSVKPLMPQLLEWKSSGRARYIGIATMRWFEHPEMMEYMNKYPIDFIQVDYSIGNRETAEDVLALATKRKIAVILDIPLKFRANWGSHGDSLLPSVAKAPLPQWAADIDVTSWSQFILKYAISHPAVTAVTPGTTSVEHLLENQLAGRGRLPDEAMRKEMEKYWDSVS